MVRIKFPVFISVFCQKQQQQKKKSERPNQQEACLPALFSFSCSCLLVYDEDNYLKIAII